MSIWLPWLCFWDLPVDRCGLLMFEQLRSGISSACLAIPWGSSWSSLLHHVHVSQKRSGSIVSVIRWPDGGWKDVGNRRVSFRIGSVCLSSADGPPVGSLGESTEWMKCCFSSSDTKSRPRMCWMFVIHFYSLHTLIWWLVVEFQLWIVQVQVCNLLSKAPPPVPSVNGLSGRSTIFGKDCEKAGAFILRPGC